MSGFWLDLGLGIALMLALAVVAVAVAVWWVGRSPDPEVPILQRRPRP